MKKEKHMSENRKKIQIRNSTTDFIVFTKQVGEDGIEVRVHNESIWLTQKAMAELFDCSTDNISLHLKNIFASKELEEDSVTEQSSATASDGKTYKMKFYNLDAIISVGYRINSIRATQFRQWATNVLRTFTIQGYVLDKQRLENGQVFDGAYFEHLLDEIREIRASERMFYQKITDIYSTAMDYSPTAKTSQDFFAAVQNKLHYAIHHHTAAELIVERADHKKEHMGLTTWKNAPGGKIVKSDVSIAKNYLSRTEIEDLNQFVTMYLDYAERQARRKIPMTMEDWAKRLDVFLEFNEEDILKNKGKVSAEIAKSFAESEFEKYRVIQDKLYQSDFDKLVQKTKKEDSLIDDNSKK
ncbi:MAG: virulence RhuM family protein [Fretibacterium sp.]|nr:virulence RhuM family protein [Fretibacterium sp.]